MKTPVIAALVLSFVASSYADIQDPPANEHGPTRKLGRGISNVVFGIAELPVQIARVNEREGNSAALSYGVVRGIGRTYMRFHAGLWEMFSFPFPTNHGTYCPILPGHHRYIHGGYEEFPPELGNESKYPYVRMY
ncbi:MAG: exosortase system-associated protein, TIGR04073 family [Chthoniobacterales bacterium]